MTFSNSHVKNESSMLQYTVSTPKPRPKMINPMMSRMILIIHMISAVENDGKIRPSRIEIPLTPPVEKLFGNLKK